MHQPTPAAALPSPALLQRCSAGLGRAPINVGDAHAGRGADDADDGDLRVGRAGRLGRVGQVERGAAGVERDDQVDIGGDGGARAGVQGPARWQDRIPHGVAGKCVCG